ncbi:MAG: hypothetical protein KDA75_07620 [Planctomycetaceae bacterium]|nr:hypothetical protein [Planctomycetaceae bacterium]
MMLLANQISVLIQSLTSRVQHADASDFGVLAVTVIVAVWYVNRYLGD